MRVLILAVTLKFCYGTDFPGFNRTVLADCENVRDRSGKGKNCVEMCKATGGDWSFEETYKTDCEVMDSCFSSWMLGDEWTTDTSSRDNKYYMEGMVKTDVSRAADCMKFCAETAGCVMFDYFPSLTNPSASYCRLRNKQHLSAILSVTFPVDTPVTQVHLDAPCTNVPRSCQALPCYQEYRNNKKVNLCIWRSKNHITGPPECKNNSTAWIGDVVKNKDKYDPNKTNHGNHTSNEIHKHTPAPDHHDHDHHDPDHHDHDHHDPDHHDPDNHQTDGDNSQRTVETNPSATTSRNKKIAAALGGTAGGLLLLGGVGYGATHFLSPSGLTHGTEFGEETQAASNNPVEREQAQDIEEQHFV